MSSRQGIPLVQDSPPPGGYPPIKPIRRQWRASGLGGLTAFVVTGAVLVLGFLKVTKFNGKRRYYTRTLIIDAIEPNIKLI